MLGLLLVTASAGLAQTTYYVAATGKDANNGQSSAAPFQSLTKVNSLVLQPGDTVLFRRGDTFRGTLRIRQSGSAGRPIVVDAYGTGPKPVVAGSVAITGWRKVGSAIWQATCSACGSRVTDVYADGGPLPLGRYPNADTIHKGYLAVQSHVGMTQLTSQQPLTTDWTGGEAVIRPTQWILDRATITKQTGNTLTLDNPSTYPLNDGWGYFIQNHPATLDQDGEWYYDPASRTVRLYDRLGNPNRRTITATVADKGVELVGVSNLVVRNLHIAQTLTTGLLVSSASNLTLTTNDITESGQDGVRITGSGNTILFTDNRITNVNNNGFQIDAYQNVVFRGNTIRHVGLSPGRGLSGDGQYNGAQFFTTLNTLVENNRIDSVGFNGLTFVTNITIQRNVISNYCMSKSDGGGLYAWNGQKRLTSDIRIRSNIIYKGIGAPEGSFQDGYNGVNGIFLDDCLQNVELTGNTVFDNHGWGIYLRGDSQITIVGNTSFNNGDAQFVMYHNGGYCPFRDNVVRQNVFVSKQPSQLVARYESNANDLNQYGLFDYNYYARPFADVFKIRAVYNWSVVDEMPLAQWQKQFSQDPNAKNSPLTYPQEIVNSVSPILRINTAFSNSGPGWSTWSPYNNAQAVQVSGPGGTTLQVSFAKPSGASDSYALVTNNMGSVKKTRSFLLRFEAMASAAKKVAVFIRQRDAPYHDLSKRVDVLVGPSRTTYELTFTATDDEPNALLVYSMPEDGNTVWFDNIRLREASLASVNPDDRIRIIYNPTQKDSLVALNGQFRDVRNHYYDRRVVLAPFTSIVLLRDSLPPIDLSMTLKTERPALAIGEVASFSLCLRNDSTAAGRVPEQADWSCRLPPNLEIVSAPGMTYHDGILNGRVQSLRTDTTFVFRARPTAAGTYKVAAQVTATSNADPDSTPDSGTGDQEDDAATVTFRAGEPNNSVFSSPNPGQMPAPTPPAELPLPTATSADLSLRTELSTRVPAHNEPIQCTIWVTNSGGATAGTVQIQNLLPIGLQFLSGSDWTVDGRMLSTTLHNLPAGSTISLTFQARVVTMGRWLNQTQITACDLPDPDSIAGNGFANGEDDAAQADFRVR